ncbi:MAG TPA: class I SAM-dependent methyltransferase [Alphaproteobacteria bacterium]|jgi:S-adenosylmethionine-dependent methyltransferase
MLLDKLAPRGSNARSVLRGLADNFRLPAPARLRRRQRRVDPVVVDGLRRFIVENYYHPAEYWETPAGRVDLHAHVEGRLVDFRRVLVPWLDRHCPLAGARILEIGCGTGASTLTLAEQGATVTGIDIDGPSLAIARHRCALYGIEAADFIEGDAGAMLRATDLKQFDMVIFFATLEHMTHDERLDAITAAWDGLRPGALLAVVDTPNRLWYFDVHTSGLSFFHWLPDEIARRYTKRCSRAIISDIHALSKDEGLLTLQRWGRGISYHDFELALGSLQDFQIIDAFGPYDRARFLPRLVKWWVSADRAFFRLLHRIAPTVHPAFLEPYLDFLARKK